jgi:hypothetical protein
MTTRPRSWKSGLPARPAHLVELLHREPVPSHGKGIEDHLRGREIHPGTERCGRNHRHELSLQEPGLHIPPLLGQAGMVRGSPDAKGIGDRMAAGPGIGEDDGLAPEPLGRGALVLLGGHLLDGRDLLLALDKEQVPLEPDRAFSVLDERTVQFLCKHFRRSDGCRKVQELCLRGRGTSAGDHAVEPVAAVIVLQHLHLIDYDRCDIAHLLPAADHVVHPFVGTDNDRCLRVPVANLPGLGQVEPAHAGQEAGLCKFPVPLREPLVLLVCQRDKRDQEKHPPPSFEEILDTRHLADERLAARSCRNDQQVLAEAGARLPPQAAVPA